MAVVGSKQKTSAKQYAAEVSVAIENDLLYAYEPVSPSINEVMNELADLVGKDRAAVVRVLDTAPAGSAVRAFANAFLIRKGGKRDG